MPRYIDPRYDVGFKLTFGRENLSEELLMGLLNALLCNNEDYEEITSVKYLNNERTAEWKEEAECESLIDKWIYNIKNMGVRQEVAFMRNNEIFKRLEKVTSVASLTPTERRSYEADVKNARDLLNQMRGAELRGEKRGHATGLAEGIEIGRDEGRAEGVVYVAKNLKAIGMSVEQIAVSTGLTEEEIMQL